MTEAIASSHDLVVVDSDAREPASGEGAAPQQKSFLRPVSRRRGWLVRRVLLLADVAGLSGAFVATQLLFGSFGGPDVAHRIDPHQEVALFVLTIPVWIVLAKLYRLYDHDEERPAHTTADDLIGVFHMVTVGVWTVAVGAWLTGVASPNHAKLVAFWAIAVALVVSTRSIGRAIARRSSLYVQRTLIVGTDEVAQLIAHKLRQRPEYGIKVLGFVSDKPGHPSVPAGIPLLGRTNHVRAIVSRLKVERVIIASLAPENGPSLGWIRSLRAADVQIDIVPQPFEALGPGGSVHMLDGVPIIGLSPIRLSASSLVLKRTMDVVLSSLGLLLASPLLALLALGVKLDTRGPVFYRHERVGQDGRPFRLLKYRTMHARYCRGSEYGGDSAEREFVRLMQDATTRAEFQSSHKLRRDPRVTRFGAILRRASLDELPQLVNVLRGDLSLVGPRPIVSEELERYGDETATLLALRPGLTGYWQINGRSDSSYPERVRLDVAYASNWSLRLDLAILAHTLRLVASPSRGAY